VHAAAPAAEQSWQAKTAIESFTQALSLTHAGDRSGKYTGVLDCFVKTARNDGLLVRAVALW